MGTTRRTVLKAMAGVGVAAATRPLLSYGATGGPPLKIGILAPRSGVAGTVGECGLRSVLWAKDRINASGGVLGRQVEFVVEEETNPKDTIQRLNKLVLQDKVDCVQGIVSSGVSLAMGPAAEDMKALTLFWDGTTQDGTEESMPHARYVFKSTDNECEAVMASLLAIKYWRGKFGTVAGVNPDYTYGRNNWAAFQALLKRFGVEHKVVAELWPKVGGLDLSSHVAALKAAKPDLVFSSMLFADLPIFMKQAHAAGLFETTKFAFPAAGWQLNALKNDFTPEGLIYGHNTLYFADPNASALQKEFVKHYADTYKEYPSWEAERAYFALAAYKAAVEKAGKVKGGAFPDKEAIIDTLEGIEVESFGGKARYRKDHVADQVFYQGFTVHDPRYDFAILGKLEARSAEKLQKPSGMTFNDWIAHGQIEA
jgi:branched-chain amino acid transport system substrate-binding protein